LLELYCELDINFARVYVVAKVFDDQSGFLLTFRNEGIVVFLEYFEDLVDHN